MASQINQPTTNARSASAQQAAKVKHYVNHQLEITRRQVKSTDLISGLVTICVFALASMLLLAIWDAWISPLSVAGRWVCLSILLIGIAVYVAVAILPLLLRKINPDYAAKMIEDAKPSFKNSLLNYVSLRRHDKTINPAVFDAVSRQAATDLASVPDDATVDRSKLIRLGFILIGLMVFAVGYKMLSPKDPLQTFGRILAPAAKIAKPAVVKISDVLPGDTQVFFGDQLEVTAIVRGRHQPQDVRLEFSTKDGQLIDQVIPMSPEGTPNRYRANLAVARNGIQQSLSYRVVALDGSSPDFDVTVHPNPTIAVESLVLTPPAYTKLPERTLSGQGNIETIEGTDVTVHAIANLPIKVAYVELLNEIVDPANSSPLGESRYEMLRSIEMKSAGKSASVHFVTQLNSSRKKPFATHYQIKFVSQDDDRNLKPNVYPIRITPDLAPEVEITSPQDRDITVPENGSVAIDVVANDLDFEISSVALHIDHQGTKLLDKNLELNSTNGNQRVSSRYQLKPTDLRLKAGDKAVFFATANDNRTSPQSGQPDPNVSRTENFTLIVSEPTEKPQPDPDQQQKQDRQQNGQKKNDQQKPGDEKSQNGSGEPKTADNKTEGKKGSASEDKSEDKQDSENEQGSGEQSTGEQGSGGSSDSQSDPKQSSEQDPSSEGGAQGQPDQQSGEDQQPTDSTGGSQSSAEGQSNEQNSDNQQAGSPQTGAGSNGQQSEDNNGAAGSEKSDSNNPSSPGAGSQSDSNPTASNPDRSPQQNGGQESGQDSTGDATGDSQANRDNNLTNGEQKPLDNNASSGEQFKRLQEILDDKVQPPSAEKKPANADQQSEDPAQNQESQNQNSDSADPDDMQNNAGQNGSSQQQDSNDNQSQGDPSKGNSAAGDSKNQNPSAPGQPGNQEKSETSSQPSDQQTEPGSQASDMENAPNQGHGQGQESATADQKSGQPESAANENSTKSADKGNQNQAAQNASDSQNKNGAQNENPTQNDSQNKSGSEQGESASDNSASGEQGNPGEPSAQGNPAQDGSEKNDNGSQSKSGQPGESQSKRGAKSEGGSPDSKGDKSPNGGSDSPNSNPDKQPSSEGEPGEGQPNGQSGNPSGNPTPQSGQSENQSSPAGSSGGGGTLPSELMEEEKTNLEHTRKATDLILKKLNDQKYNPDPKLLEEMNWSQADLDQFLQRWQEMKQKAESGDTKAQAKYEKSLKSLGLRPENNRRAARQNEDDVRGLNEDNAVIQPPHSLAPDFNATLRDLNRVRDK